MAIFARTDLPWLVVVPACASLVAGATDAALGVGSAIMDPRNLAGGFGPVFVAGWTFVLVLPLTGIVLASRRWRRHTRQ